MEQFAVEKVHETDLGLIIFDGDKEISLPKSQTKIIKESNRNSMMLIEIPEWLAITEGLI